MVRSALLKAIYNVLNSHPYLAVEDFKIEEYKSKKDDPCLLISYRYNATWHFKFHIPNSKQKSGDSTWESYWFNCTMNPGRESAEENLNAEERSGLLKEIEDWLKRLYEDIVSTPVVRQFEAHSSEIEKLKERFDQLPEEPLSRDDVTEFREDLDRIKAEFVEQLKQEIADKEELKQRVDELGRDIEFLKQSLESMTKRQWSEILVVRLRKWKERFSLRQLASGARVLKRLLPPNVSEELDAVADVVDEIADVVEKIPPPQ